MEKVLQTKEKPNKRTSIISLVSLICISVALLMMLIGFFGDVYQQKVTIEGQTEVASIGSLSFFFKDGWEQYFQNDYDNANLQAFCQMSYLMHFISYASIIFGLVFGGIKLGEGWVGYAKKTSVTNKQNILNKVILCTTIPYIFMTMMIYGSFVETHVSGEFGIDQVSSTSYGWGSILVIIALAMIIASTILTSLCTNGKIDVKHAVLKNISVFVVLFIAIFAFSRFVGIKGGEEGYSLEYSFGFYSYASYMVALNAGSGEWFMFWFGFILVVATIILLMLATIQSKTKNSLIFFAVALGVSILASIMCMEAIKKSMPEVGSSTDVVYGISFIIQIILIGTGTGVLIGDLASSKKNVKVQKA